MRALIGIILLVSFLSQTCSNLVVYSCYHISKDYVSKNLCENRNKPQLNCNGKCHLSKQLKQVEQNEEKSLAGMFKGAEEVVYTEWGKTPLMYVADWNESSIIPQNSFPLLAGINTEMPRPPQFVS